MDSLREAFISEGVWNIQLRPMEGIYVLLTFDSVEDMNSMLEGRGLCWLMNWFVEVKQWTLEPSMEYSRVVWLNCYGIPLNVWNVETFYSISKLWGKVITLDEETSNKSSFAVGKVKISTNAFEIINNIVNLELNGIVYPIRVVEQHVGVTSFVKAVCECNGGSNAKLLSDSDPEVKSGGEKGENVLEDVEDDDMIEVAKNANLDASMDLNFPNNGVEVVSIVDETQLVDVGLQCKNVKAAVMDSVSSSSNNALSPVGNGKCPINSSVDPGVNQENYLNNNFLGHDDCYPAVPTECDPELFLDDIGVEVGPPLEHLEVNEMIPVKAAIKGVKGKKKRKSINDILGFSKVDLHNRKGGRNKQKCVVFRSAVAAAALSASISSEGIVNRNKMFLSEAQAIWSVNKTMGIGYDGDEEEVISKIADSLAQDKDRTPT